MHRLFKKKHKGSFENASCNFSSFFLGDDIIESTSVSPDSPRSEEAFSPVVDKRSAGSEELRYILHIVILLMYRSLKDFTTNFLGNATAKKQAIEAGDDQTFDSEDRKGKHLPWASL